MEPTRRDLLRGAAAGLATLALPGCADPPSCAEPTRPGGRAELAAIDTFVFVVMENRSFDHYLGSLALEGACVDGLTGDEWNPDEGGRAVPVHRTTRTRAIADPAHRWEDAHAQWNGGANDGFVTSNAYEGREEVMGYYTRAELPVTYALADAGAVCHRWFCSVLGPTWPNRMYLLAGTSGGERTNTRPPGIVTVVDDLRDAGVPVRNYYSDESWAAHALGLGHSLAQIGDYYKDAAAGTLPAVSFVDPRLFGEDAEDDHPNRDVGRGQAFLGRVTDALAASPQWSRSLLVITYDEHGGFHDHVPPPEAVDDDPEFRRLGFRVPTIAIGPTVRRGPIDTVLEHASICATLWRRFGLPERTARAAAAADLSVCLDPARVA